MSPHPRCSTLTAAAIRDLELISDSLACGMQNRVLLETVDAGENQRLFISSWSFEANAVAQCYTQAMPALDYPHITHSADNVARLDRLPRIRVAQIAADHVGNGWSAEEIVRQYPYLTAGEVHAALGYFYDHRGD